MPGILRVAICLLVLSSSVCLCRSEGSSSIRTFYLREASVNGEQITTFEEGIGPPPRRMLKIGTKPELGVQPMYSGPSALSFVFTCESPASIQITSIHVNGKNIPEGRHWRSRRVDLQFPAELVIDEMMIVVLPQKYLWLSMDNIPLTIEIRLKYLHPPGGDYYIKMQGEGDYLIDSKLPKD